MIGYPKKTYKIAIFASGGGSNALKIIEYFQEHPVIEVSLIVTNNSGAGVLQIAQKHHIPSHIISKKMLQDRAYVLDILQSNDVNVIVLAGFLLLVPDFLITSFHTIFNIHPSLLPKYGGKGMYGHFVHEAVYANKDLVSGCTIHLVNEEYDKGQILNQVRCQVALSDTADDIAAKVLALEHQQYSPTIERYLMGLLQTEG
jgi:phosphoribosylglycinamide formyltransferase 1